MLGLGVIINGLKGNADSVNTFKGALGKTITKLVLGEDDALHFTFDDGSKIKLFDNGQLCCESRYMRTDDVLADYIGAQLLGAEIKDVPTSKGIDEWKDVHEVQFLEVRTSKGCFTMSSHNEHNGYYSGFSIQAVREE